MATRLERIKGLKEKTSSALYTPLIPFGTDGKLVDMLSGLDLEEDLIIGGNYFSTINETSSTEMSISETFAKQIDVNNGTATNYYKIESTITEDTSGNTIIDRKLWFIVDSSTNPELVQRKIITITDTGQITEIEEELNP